MAIKLRGLEDRDVANVSPGFPNELKRAGGGQYIIDDRLGLIEFPYPINNMVLSDNLSLPAKLLGLGKEEVKGIKEFTLAYDRVSEELVPVTKINSSYVRDYELGAGIIRVMFDRFDRNAAIEEEIFKAFIDCCVKSKLVDDLSDIGTINHDKNGILLFSDYYIEITASPDILKSKSSFEDIKDYFKYKVFSNDSGRLTLLLNVPEENYKVFWQKYLIILPYSMRPNIGNRKDSLTTVYTKVESRAEELATLLQRDYTMESFKEKLKALETAVVELQYKASSKKEGKERAIVERLKGKTGHIRGKSLSKRQDYSARAAVICNPFMSLTNIGVPNTILTKILEHYIENPNISSQHDSTKMKEIRSSGLLERIPVLMGRQPTLHRYSIQAFLAVESTANAIEVNPLCVILYNMDFDGDTAFTEVPNTPEGVQDVRNHMMITKNLYSLQTGDCTTYPRHEIVYGLYMCTRSTYTIGTSVADFPKLTNIRAAVIQHKVKVWDTVTVNGKPVIAGYAAFQSCFPYNVEVREITSKTIKRYVDDALESKNIGRFVKIIDSLVELGFKVAYLYTESLSLLKPYNHDDTYDSALPEFNSSMEEEDNLYDMGLEDSVNYGIAFESAYGKMSEAMRISIGNVLGEHNGYKLLANSGARGNDSNLCQIFSLKGCVMRNSGEAFHVAIKKGYVDMLDSLEHHLTAYGGREGQIDKTIKTADTGYLSRQLWHTTEGAYIICEDCGTDDGIEISKTELLHFTDSEEEAEELFAFILRGRYTAGDNIYLDRTKVDNIIKSGRDKVKIRSPLTCKNPYCVKCYGEDPGTHDTPVINLPIGVIAAQSIGEPGTQLTMNVFHHGGVVGADSAMSQYSRMSSYLHCSSLRELCIEGKFPSYDPLAWGDGEIIIGKVSKPGFKTVKIDGCKGSVQVPEYATLKGHVKKGESISVVRGDYDLSELIRYRGIREAQQYLCYTLYNIYKSECSIVLKHFEVLVAEMTQHMIISSNKLPTGLFCSTKELLERADKDTVYVSNLISIKYVPFKSSQAMRPIVFEDVVDGISRAVLFGKEDELKLPLARIIMGLSVKEGLTETSDYII